MVPNNFKLTQEQARLQVMIREIANASVRPVAARIDELDEYPRDMLHLLSEAGVAGVMVPKEYGGLGEGLLTALLMQEELGRASASVCLMMTVPMLAGLALTWYGNEEQRKTLLPPMVKGAKLFNFSLTEPSGGSDVANMKTFALKDADSYVLNGHKRYVCNASVADYYSIYAKTDPAAGIKGLSLFIIPRETPGISSPRVERKMGMRGHIHGDVLLKNCRVSSKNLVGNPGDGFLIAMKSLDPSRVLLAGNALGIAQEAYERALHHAKNRVAFGKPISKHQAIAFMLADMALDIQLGSLLTYNCAQLADQRMNYTKEASMTKLFVSDMAMRITDKAMRIFGGEGYSKGTEAAIERLFRDARAFEVMEGTSEMQRLVISREILRDS